MAAVTATGIPSRHLLDRLVDEHLDDLVLRINGPVRVEPRAATGGR